MLARLREQRIGLHMVDLVGDVATNGVSKLLFTTLSAVAEAERDRIRERIQEVKTDHGRAAGILAGLGRLAGISALTAQ